MARSRFRVEWAEAAVRDLDSLAGFLATRSERDAERIVALVERRAATLESSPTRGRIVPELSRFGMQTWRELIVRPWRVVYRIEGDVVMVLALFDGRRDLEDVLLERLIRMP